MKRLIVFILISLFLCIVNMKFSKNVTIRDIFPEAEIDVFLNNVPEGNYKYVINGSGCIIRCNLNEFYDIQKVHKIAGYTIKVDGYSFEKVSRNLAIQDCFFKGGYMYGYSYILESAIYTDGHKVNVQCAICDGKMLIGTPILLGSY